MIEAMKRATVICLRDDVERTAGILQELEVIHLEAVPEEESSELFDALHDREKLERLLYQLDEFCKGAPDQPPDAIKRMSGEELFHRAEAGFEHLAAGHDRYEQLLRWRDLLQPWGDFKPEHLDALRKKGMDIRLCAGAPDLLEELELPDTAAVEIIAERRDGVYFVVMSDRSLADLELPEVQLPDERLGDVESDMRDCEKEQQEARDALCRLAAARDKLHEYYEAVADKADLLTARDSMADLEQCRYLRGYVPAKQTEKLREAAGREGWAVVLEDPETDDPKVPTLLTVPNWARVAMPLLDFVGIRPGYKEFDISAWFLLAFCVFFAMIFGDAGYGAILLVTALALKPWMPQKSQVSLNLLSILGGCTLVWGWLSGNWFGVDPEIVQSQFPAFMQGLDWFRDPNLKNIPWLCFLIGAIHLSIGHLWRAAVVINSPRCLSQFGWIAVLWGFFFLASTLVVQAPYPALANWLFGIGGVLILFFSAPNANPLKAVGVGVGEILGNAINSFVDIVSYIRLFAVGMSSFYVANSFNDMGAMVAGAIPVGLLGILVGGVVIILGHVLNFALASLGVLVHGIRLNTLEFSGHIGMEWSGTPFKPFARRRRMPESGESAGS